MGLLPFWWASFICATASCNDVCCCIKDGPGLIGDCWAVETGMIPGKGECVPLCNPGILTIWTDCGVPTTEAGCGMPYPVGSIGL